MKKNKTKTAETEVLEAEVIIPEKGVHDKPVRFVATPPAVIQEAVAGEAILEIKNSLDAVHLFGNETELPREQSMCATYHIARAYLQDSLNAFEDLSDSALTPSVRGWRLVARDSLAKLKDMGAPDHTNQEHLRKIATIVTEFLAGAHLMLSQTTSNRERRDFAGKILAGINDVKLLSEQGEEHVH